MVDEARRRSVGDETGRVRALGRRALGAALVLLTAGASGCHPMDDALEAVFGRSMRDQPYLAPYENPLPPAEGSVPFASGNFPASRGEVNVGQSVGTSDIPPPFTQADIIQQTPVVEELENPVPPDAESLARGEELYNRACVPCHGASGAGDGPVTQAGYPPFPVVGARAAGFSDGFLYGIIRVGRGLMPAYGHQLSHYDRWHVVNYLRQLQGVLPEQGDAGDDSDSGQG